LRLTVPIFEGGLTSAVTQEAVYRHQKSQEDVEQERRGVERLDPRRLSTARWVR
jgi:outer membrane protein TolC